MANSSNADETPKSTPKPTPTPTPTRTTPKASGTRATNTDEAGTLPSDGPKPTDASDNGDEPTPSFDASYDETGMPGSVMLTTPDYMTIPTPMFEIGQNITLGWKYTNDTQRPPSKLSICGKFPSKSGLSSDVRSLCDWDIAVNISGSLSKYVWDTTTHGAPGIAFVASTGYLLYFYDGDYGINNPRPGAGRIVPSQFWFAMYNSRYDQTNQGVPVGYNPSPASAVTVRVGTMAAIAMLGIVGILL
ncbi:hypothetical protein LPJ61_000752 [Coemansia biformis]|uniref:DUF7137 domain-containing protein n=1 Tax=Coemansia biformis TaxID=1286918 RepID=A0A9W8D1C0_9FUNG|nr:hypothetical protein LPJ61_000752 [Coemansia biformis]